MHSTTIENMLSRSGEEENYWGFLGFWNRVGPGLAEHGIELRLLLSEAFLPLLETPKARSNLGFVLKLPRHCLYEEYFDDLWGEEANPDRDALVKQSFGMGDYAPDLIIGHDDLKKMPLLFPGSLMLGIEVGAFSRPPYPKTFFFDPLSFDCQKIVEAYSQSSAAAFEKVKDILPSMREALFTAFNDVPEAVQQYLEQLKRKHRHIVLLAVQYPSPRYSPYIAHETASDFIVDILRSCDDDTAILVCPRKHNFQNLGFTQEQFEQLQTTYPNIHFFPEDLMWPYYTQYLVPHVTGVIAVTSTVGLQAAIWGKYWFTSEQSFYRSVTPSYKEMRNVLAAPLPEEAGRYVNWMSQYFWMADTLIRETDLLARFLMNIQAISRSESEEILWQIRKLFEAEEDLPRLVVENCQRQDNTVNEHGVLEVISL